MKQRSRESKDSEEVETRIVRKESSSEEEKDPGGFTLGAKGQ